MTVLVVVVLCVVAVVSWFGTLARATRLPLASQGDSAVTGDPASTSSTDGPTGLPWWTGVPLAIGCGAVASSPAILLAGPLLTVAVRLGRQRWREHRRRRLVSIAVVDFVDRLALELRSGSSLPPAVRRALDEGTDALRQALEGVDRGLSAGEPVDVAIRRGLGVDDGLDLVAVTLTVLTHNGGPALAALDRVSDTLHAAARGDAEARSQSSQAMASAAVMAAIPVVFAAVVALVEPRAAAFYFSSVVGGVCVAAALVLVALGLAWIDRSIGGLR